MSTPPERRLTSSHWGAGLAVVDGGRLVDVEPHPADPAPSPINANIASSLNGAARVLCPAIRAGWLENGPGGGDRGREPFVEVSWDEALDAIAGELSRVHEAHGAGSIFAGSYGWASAGRTHHAQSLLKRFLNTQGGFVPSDGNYSYHAALKLMPHIVGPFRAHVAQSTRWSVIARHSELVVMFGGVPMRNTQIGDGGLSKHRAPDAMRACAEAGVRFVSLSPLREDADEALNAEWLTPRPGSDVAVMMGLAHTLLTEDLHDRAFLERYTTGFPVVERYLLGHGDDGVAKDADWAAALSGLPAERIRALAREMASRRTMIACAAALQRADYGEQPLWMTVTLAAMLGQIGLPGGGYTIGYGVNGSIGSVERPFRWGTVPQGRNPVTDIVPVAMIADMLLNPGAPYPYDGRTQVFPDIRLVWWAGGNPFHHHQDLNRLREAFQRPETVIVNEINWTATARHADIVLPVAASQERDDFGAGKADNTLVPMPRLMPPPGEARLEFDIYADLARRLGEETAFTDGLDAQGWMRRLWADTQAAAGDAGVALPPWDDFIRGDIVTVPDPSPDQVFLAEFRADPEAHALPTPSGKIELYSERIARFG
ncbi:MAG: molybdopterin-dependent oxidoreductase, partial [Pseudomonadota bacterium]